MKSIIKLTAALISLALVIGMMGCSQPSGDGSNAGETSGGTEVKPGDTASKGIKIGETTYAKTSEVVIIPAGKTGVIDMKDDSSWDTYTSTTGDYAKKFKGVFIKDRKVTLSPFIMSQYEVTQELYKAVLSDDTDCKAEPSRFSDSPADGETQNLRPVENVTWYDAVYFCNKLSEKQNLTLYYTITDITRDDTDKYITSATVSKNSAEGVEYGYRLPTEAEWEYAARGGNPHSAEWKNAFGKVTTKDNAKVYDGSNFLDEDENLATVGWYSKNSGSKTHEVGLKEKNNLNIYDMQGNVFEWCWDWYGNDIATGEVTDPVGKPSGSSRCFRGGMCDSDVRYSAVSYRIGNAPNAHGGLGFRVVRSAQ